MMKTIQITIDAPLLDRLDGELANQRSRRSSFIREAIESELRRRSIRAMEAAWEAAYTQGGADVVIATEQDWGPGWDEDAPR